jgi:hypothetical protein
MAETVKVIVQAEDAASGVLRGITSQFGALGGMIDQLTAKNVNWGNVAEAATVAVINGMKEAIDTTIKYNTEIHNLSLASGESMESSSRLVQTLEDYGVTVDDLLVATKALTREGLAPNMETIAQLSDKYNTLTTAQEKNEFILKNLGKGGLAWAEALSQGGDALKKMSTEVNAGLIATQKSYQATLDYRLSLDALQDSWDGMVQTLGGAVIPVLILLMNTMTKAGDIAVGLADQIGTYIELRGAIDNHRDAVINYTNSLVAQGMAEDAARKKAEEMVTAQERVDKISKQAAEGIKGSGKAAEETAVNYQTLISSIQNMQQESDRYTDTTQKLMDQRIDLNAQMTELQAELAKVTSYYGGTSKAAQDVQGKIDALSGKMKENEAAVKENEAAHLLWAKNTIYSFAVARAAAGGTTEAEGKFLIDLGVQLGLFDQKTADTMTAVNKSMDTLNTEGGQAEIKKLQDAIDLLMAGSPYVPVVVVDTSGAVVTPPSTVPPTTDSWGYPVTTHAEGTDGWLTVPAGYNNDSYMVGLTSGEQYAVIPNDRSKDGGAGGANNYFYGNNTFIIGGGGESFMEQR